ncbi:MAG: ZIP family metal transporter, partial [Bacilli bacterium]|nr:ZIP family metal transporter [Bacilli bacterium]
MPNYVIVIIGLAMPFVGTALGASMVIFAKNGIKPWLQKILLGFASGVMIAASIWSLLIPSLEAEVNGGIIPAIVGFAVGMGFLLLLDTIIPHLHINSDKPEGVKTRKVNRT